MLGEVQSILDININAYFPLKQKGKCPPNLLIPPRISVTHFASPGVPLDYPGYVSITHDETVLYLTRFTAHRIAT